MTQPADSYHQEASPHGWSPMSPDQIRRHQFTELGLVRRGYKAEEVDAYLGKVARDVDNWATSYSQLRAEVNRLRNWYREHDIDIDAAQRRQVSIEAANILIQAQQQADQIIADAHTQARHVQSDARSHGDAILEQARREAERAAHAYRIRSGPEYSPEREELERWAVWGRSLLAAINAARATLEATGDAFAYELAKLSPLSEAPPDGETPTAGPSIASAPTGARAVVYEQLKRPWE
jgi:DivIVA domain-containing protein